MDIFLIFMIVCFKKKDDAISGISKLDYIIKVSCTQVYKLTYEEKKKIE